MKKKLCHLRIPKRHFPLKVNARMVIDLFENGQYAPILVKNNMIIDGVVRYLAAEQLGWKEIDAVIIPKEFKQFIRRNHEHYFYYSLRSSGETMKLSKLRLSKRILPPKVNEMMVDLFENGQKTPILVRGHLVIDGVCRCLAARSLGWEEIEVAL